jgi:hypothetical protein
MSNTTSDMHLNNVTSNGVTVGTLTTCDLKGCIVETNQINTTTPPGLVWFTNQIPESTPLILLPLLEVSVASIEGQADKVWPDQFTYDECLIFGPGIATWTTFGGNGLAFFRELAVPLCHRTFVLSNIC